MKIPNIRQINRGSNLWQGIYSIWKHIKNGLKWSIGNEMDVHFWLDAWISEIKALSMMDDVHILNFEINFPMALYVNSNKE